MSHPTGAEDVPVSKELGAQVSNGEPGQDHLGTRVRALLQLVINDVPLCVHYRLVLRWVAEPDLQPMCQLLVIPLLGLCHCQARLHGVPLRVHYRLIPCRVAEPEVSPLSDPMTHAVSLSGLEGPLRPPQPGQRPSTVSIIVYADMWLCKQDFHASGYVTVRPEKGLMPTQCGVHVMIALC